ncbi:DsrE family protein [Halorussus salinisoli]|uniref:DsrE family protein n=1 Tax=Halorussus salinisoli TaxID=2558242 RepID=UPI0010C191F6|nr:DsrE family protein [Halorussus salinisoli]
MERRSFVSAAGTLGALLFGSESVSAARQRCESNGQDARPTPPAKTVIHLSSGDEMEQKMALHNAKNLVEDESVSVKNLVFVANSKGVKVYTPPNGGNEFYELVNSLQERGVTFRACGNAMDALGLTEKDLVDGVEPVPSAVGELSRLQELGYGYIKAP